MAGDLRVPTCITLKGPTTELAQSGSVQDPRKEWVSTREIAHVTRWLVL